MLISKLAVSHKIFENPACPPTNFLSDLAALVSQTGKFFTADDDVTASNPVTAPASEYERLDEPYHAVTSFTEVQIFE